jgi:hypothetical protein
MAKYAMAMSLGDITAGWPIYHDHLQQQLYFEGFGS